MPMSDWWRRKKNEQDTPEDPPEAVEREPQPRTRAAVRDDFDDSDLDPEERAALRRAAGLEGDANDARKARARAVDQITLLRKTEREALERAMREEAEAERAAQERVTAERAASELAEAEAAATERASAERATAEAAGRRRAEAERLVREHTEVEQKSRKRAQEERAKAERAAEERQLAEVKATETAQLERDTSERATELRRRAEEAIDRRRAAEKGVEELVAKERALRARLAAERAAAARAAAERSLAAQAALERAQTELAEAERQAAERAHAAKSIAERLAKAQAQAERAQSALGHAEDTLAELGDDPDSEEWEDADTALEQDEESLESEAEWTDASEPDVPPAEMRDDLETQEEADAEHTEVLPENDEDEGERPRLPSAPPAEELAALGEFEDDYDESELSELRDDAEVDDEKASDDAELEAATAPDTDSETGDDDETPGESGSSSRDGRRSRGSRGKRGIASKGARIVAPVLLVAGLVGVATAAVQMPNAPGTTGDGVRLAPLHASVELSVSHHAIGLRAPATSRLASLASLALLERRTDPEPVPDNRPAWIRHAVPVLPDDTLPLVALVIDDMGVDAELSAQVIAMPSPLTVAFLPYAEQVQDQARRAHESGHELLLHVPMEPNSHLEDPGPRALHVELGNDEIDRRLEWALGRVPGVVGINNHMGSRFTRDPQRMRRVMERLARGGLLFLDSMTSPHSIGWRLAQKTELPYTTRNVFLDHESGDAPVRPQRAALVRTARRRGAAVGIGHPRPDTIRVLNEWIPRAHDQGVRLVPVTAIVRQQHGL